MREQRNNKLLSSLSYPLVEYFITFNCGQQQYDSFVHTLALYLPCWMSSTCMRRELVPVPNMRSRAEPAATQLTQRGLLLTTYSYEYQFII
jgi:hypothetical protein